MTEVLFYHLEHQPLERVLPALVERTLARGGAGRLGTGWGQTLRV
jgi:DNA polymerase-3 subunit chi